MGNYQVLVILSPVFGYEAMMDKERKRFLKEVGKLEVQRQSAALNERMRKANPYETSDPRWAQAYKLGTQRERWLSRKCPTLHKEKLEKFFVVEPYESAGWVPSVRVYLQCLLCGSALPSQAPKRFFSITGCRCHNIFSWQFLKRGGFRIRQFDKVQPIKLIGRG